ncbi:CLUMA_CG013589, isoform A [Clunio marinus]|uniref:CLUMA_CG013589, isoform A n=1 Tax=Clunio marinus TaxID=568069 RepID=A0A1J1IL83_9DIPT|nr:CLUMA_CG013589, isoform A [Clunio marinus]
MDCWKRSTAVKRSKDWISLITIHSVDDLSIKIRGKIANEEIKQNRYLNFALVSVGRRINQPQFCPRVKRNYKTITRKRQFWKSALELLDSF